jgi:hypothetical protein
MVVMDVWGVIDGRFEVIWWLVDMVGRKWDVLVAVMMTDGLW